MDPSPHPETDTAAVGPPPDWAAALIRLGRGTLNGLRMPIRVLGLIAAALMMLARGGSDGQRISLVTVLRRIVDIGPLALGLTVLFGVSIGLVLGILLKTWLELADLLEIAVAQATTLTVEQVAPLFVAIMVAAHSGAALAADLGTMVASREIDALRSLGLSPERMLVAPAILGALVAVPLLTLTMIACIVLTFALYLQVNGLGSVSLTASLALNAIEPATLATGMGKAALFGPLIAAIAAAEGLAEQPTIRLVGIGVSNATVTMISTILLLNALLTLLF